MSEKANASAALMSGLPSADEVKCRIASVRKESADAGEKFERLLAEQSARILELQVKLQSANKKLEQQKEFFERREKEMRDIFEEDLNQIDEDYKKAYYDVMVQQREVLSSSLSRSAFASLEQRQRRPPVYSPAGAGSPSTMSKAVQATWTYSSRKHACTNTEPSLSGNGTVGTAELPHCCAELDGTALRDLVCTVAEANLKTDDLIGRLGLAQSALEKCSRELALKEKPSDAHEMVMQEVVTQVGSSTSLEAQVELVVARQGIKVGLACCELLPFDCASDDRKDAAARPTPKPKNTARIKEPLADKMRSVTEDLLEGHVGRAVASRSDRGSDVSQRTDGSLGSARPLPHPPSRVEESSLESGWSTATDRLVVSPSPSCASIDSLECGRALPPAKSSNSLEKFAENLLAALPRAAPLK